MLKLFSVDGKYEKTVFISSWYQKGNEEKKTFQMYYKNLYLGFSWKLFKSK